MVAKKIHEKYDEILEIFVRFTDGGHQRNDHRPQGQRCTCMHRLSI